VTLVLWDIDGTLVRCGSVGADVFDRAIAATVGTPPPVRVPMSGKTDPQIAAEHLAAMGWSPVDIEAVLPAVLARLAAELAEARAELAAQATLPPGVGVLLPRLAAEGGCRQSTLTGNIAPNAAVKLGVFGLERWLDLEIGAYGSDARDRRELVPVALARAEARRGWRFEPREVWVVGDSPNDLACARAAGVRCLLVATGRFGVDELAAEVPDAVAEDLADVDAMAGLLRSVGPAVNPTGGRGRRPGRPGG